jgi:hypothetical protein
VPDLPLQCELQPGLMMTAQQTCQAAEIVTHDESSLRSRGAVPAGLMMSTQTHSQL